MRLSKKIIDIMTGPISMSRERAIGSSERLAALTTLMSSFEYLAQRDQIRKGGLNDWSIIRDTQVHSAPIIRRVSDAVSSEKATTFLHVARTAVSTAMLMPGKGKWRGIANLFLAASTATLFPRHRYGTDGTDQVTVHVHLATGVARLASATQTKDAALWYVALQANLSYIVSGWVKLIGEPWRDGSALNGVMRTVTYGHKPTFELIQRFPKTAKHVTRGVLLLECLFPVAYLAGGRLAKPIVGSAGVFHVTNGLLMGLGRFVPAFASMHPIIAYTSAPATHPAVEGRDDRSVAVAATLLVGGLAIAGVAASGRRMRILESWPRSRTTITRHGNTIQYELSGNSAEDAPIMIFLPALAATAEHFSWIADRLRRHGKYGLLTYARAGYANSRRHKASPFSVEESVDDLADLIDHVIPKTRKIVLIGHSVGGDLARRTAIRLGERVHTVVYLDSAHPGELLRSQQQSDIAKYLTSTLSSMVWSLRMGLGILMPRPDWLEALPATSRQRVYAQYSDVRLWEAARREWSCVEADFRNFSGELPLVAAHALVVSAQRTIQLDPEQLVLHDEIADAHRQGGHSVKTFTVQGAGHDSMITDSRFANTVADQIILFLNAKI
ncbi:alpha/beta fold hydrolase [Nonomuraea sp. NPDC005650]|uniref:alpha/beta fold hydrolase n=1 Tax=Nonomuraea sp. NPDC005650 TaxID=3157045 RepID=UPI0033B2AB83